MPKPPGTTKITAKQRQWCRHVATGSSDTEAYKKAYGCTQKTAETNACRLRADEGVMRELDKLVAKEDTKAVLTAQQVKEGLSRMMAKAEQEGNFAGYTALANRLAKMEAHDEPERHKMEFEINIGGDGDTED